MRSVNFFWFIDFFNEFEVYQDKLPVDIVDEIHWARDVDDESRLIEISFE